MIWRFDLEINREFVSLVKNKTRVLLVILIKHLVVSICCLSWIHDSIIFRRELYLALKTFEVVRVDVTWLIDFNVSIEDDNNCIARVEKLWISTIKQNVIIDLREDLIAMTSEKLSQKYKVVIVSINARVTWFDALSIETCQVDIFIVTTCFNNYNGQENIDIDCFAR